MTCRCKESYLDECQGEGWAEGKKCVCTNEKDPFVLGPPKTPIKVLHKNITVTFIAAEPDWPEKHWTDPSTWPKVKGS